MLVKYNNKYYFISCDMLFVCQIDCICSSKQILPIINEYIEELNICDKYLNDIIYYSCNIWGLGVNRNLRYQSIEWFKNTHFISPIIPKMTLITDAKLSCLGRAIKDCHVLEIK